MIANKDVQGKTLENFRANQTEVIVFFLNGLQMRGVIEKYDKHVISLNPQDKQHLAYKHTISTYTVETKAQEPTESEE